MAGSRVIAMPGRRRLEGMLWLGGLMTLAGAGCLTSANQGIDPPLDRMAFVTGLVLEGDAPTGQACDQDTPCPAGQGCQQGQCSAAPSRLIAANANSNRDYNGSALVVFDLDRFFDATGLEGFAKAPASATLLDPGATPTADAPCRKDAVMPGIVECEESFFSMPDAGVAMGVFAGNPVAMTQADGQRQIVVPVRGEPSVTVVDVMQGPQGMQLRCADAPDARRCDADHKLRFVRNTPELGRLPMHPRGVVTDAKFDPPLAVLAHDSRPEITLVGFEAAKDDEAMILDTVPLLSSGPSGLGGTTPVRGGGSDLAMYPCTPANEGGTPPLSTRNCTEPLLYASYRNRARVDLISVSHAQDVTSKPSCVRAEKAGVSTFGCGVGARRVASFSTGAIRPFQGASADMMGASAFSPDASYFYLLQRAPGVLLRFDTRVDPVTQMPKNEFAGAVDVCEKASSLLLYSGERNYGVVTCRDAAEIYLVDLDSFTVLKTIKVAANPSGMAADLAREVVYVASFLNANVSVIDMSNSRPTRHSVVARLGLLEEIE